MIKLRIHSSTWLEVLEKESGEAILWLPALANQPYACNSVFEGRWGRSSKRVKCFTVEETIHNGQECFKPVIKDEP